MDENREQVFSVSSSTATPASSITLAEAGFTERGHLQEWVIANPTILGAGVKIVTAELGRWVTASGGKENDRLDVLGLDQEGRLVVAELKRGVAPDTVQMQAIKYAAMANRFDLDKLSVQHAEFLRSRGMSQATLDEAQAMLLEHAPEVSEETLRPPRIVLLASAFPHTVTASAVFLHEVGLEITLMQFSAYRTPAAEVVVTVSQMFPLQSVEDFTLTPTVARRKAEKERTRAARVVSRLVDAQAVPDGTLFRLSGLPEEGQGAKAVRDWVTVDPARGEATWVNSRSKPLVWKYDQQAYAPSGLVWEIYESAAGPDHPSAFWGPAYWTTEDGTTMWDLAQGLS
jgi:hypothetical protein